MSDIKSDAYDATEAAFQAASGEIFADGAAAAAATSETFPEITEPSIMEHHVEAHTGAGSTYLADKVGPDGTFHEKTFIPSSAPPAQSVASIGGPGTGPEFAHTAAGAFASGVPLAAGRYAATSMVGGLWNRLPSLQTVQDTGVSAFSTARELGTDVYVKAKDTGSEWWNSTAAASSQVVDEASGLASRAAENDLINGLPGTSKGWGSFIWDTVSEHPYLTVGAGVGLVLAATVAFGRGGKKGTKCSKGSKK